MPEDAVMKASKDLYDNYLRVARDWQHDGSPSSRPAPQKPQFRVMQTLSGWDAKRVAEARAAQYQNRYEFAIDKQDDAEGQTVEPQNEGPKPASEPVADPAK